MKPYEGKVDLHLEEAHDKRGENVSTFDSIFLLLWAWYFATPYIQKLSEEITPAI